MFYSTYFIKIVLFKGEIGAGLIQKGLCIGVLYIGPKTKVPKAKSRKEDRTIIFTKTSDKREFIENALFKGHLRLELFKKENSCGLM